MTQQGFFNDPVGRRFGIDIDGTRAFTTNSGGGISDQSSSLLAANNGNGGPNIYGAGGQSVTYTTIYFPEKRDLTHAYMNWYGGNSTFGHHNFAGCSISPDSTSPINGTFTGVSFGVGGDNRNPQQFSHAGVIAVRFAFDLQDGVGTAYWQITNINFWGIISPPFTPHRLEFVDAGGARLPIDFDFGDIPKGSTRIWGPGNTYNESSPVYVKNLSTQKTANNVVVAVEAVQNNEMNTVESISLDNVTFSASLAFSSIAPNNSVGPIFVKYAPPTNNTLGLKISRLKSTVASWT